MATPPPPTTFLTAQELAKRWQVSRAFVYRLKDEGRLPYHQIGSAIRFALADVEAYEQRGRVSALHDPIELRRRRPTP